jgi:hypothetical protein
VFVCALCYSGAAVLGYLTFGGLVNDDILMSYPADRVEVQGSDSPIFKNVS